MKIKSPCTGHCVHRDGICSGCGRTLNEIGEWSGATDDRKKQILNNITLRDNDKNTDKP